MMLKHYYTFDVEAYAPIKIRDDENWVTFIEAYQK
jgi:hypothetical protein